MIQPENVAIVLADKDTGKAYYRPLTQWETNLVLMQLQALDDDKLKLIECEPFILKGK